MEIHSVEQLCEVLGADVHPILVLGGGSNVLFTKDYEGLVIVNRIGGRSIIQEDASGRVVVRAGAGENWHQFVLWCLDNGLSGIENLSLIPGTVGAGPIQNIGAYGVELKDVFVELEAIRIADKKHIVFNHDDCQFEYRDSIFKQEGKGKYIITSVTLALSRSALVHISYGAIRNTLAEMQITNPTPRDVSNAIIAIRSAKLPDPDVLPNAGSFFKNPEMGQDHFLQLQKEFPNIVHYNLPNGNIKVPAGWLIEQCGWKGKRVGNVGCHTKQALVIVNYDNATGTEIWEHALRVRASVERKFGIVLQAEVNIV